jgi:PKD repeat protein
MELSWSARPGRRISAALGLCCLLLLPRLARAQYSTCTFPPSNVTSTEAWTATNGIVLCSGTYNVQSFSVPAGVTVYVVAGGFVTINATSWIEVSGTLNADYAGGVGGTGCVSGTSARGGSGSGTGGGSGGISEYYGGFGGGGGAYGCTGNSCGGSGGFPVYDTGSTSGGSPYDSNTSIDQDVGSGGGGGGCAVYQYPAGGQPGGAGGGGISLIAPQVQIDAASEIFTYGANGSGGSTGGGGGGGSGGNITVSADTILSVSTSAYVQATGGAGGAGGAATNGGAQYIGGGGGGGSGGRIKYFGPSTCTPVGNVAGGAGGAGATLSGKSSAAGTAGGSGDLTCTAVTPLTATASASPSPIAPNASTTITVTPSNPSGYLLAYQYDCTGTGTSYSAATSATSTTCSWATTGAHTVDVKVLAYNAAPLINGTAAGGYLVTSYTTTVTVQVGVAPIVVLTVPATSSIGQAVSLKGTVSDSNGATSYTYAWNFGDGTGSSSSSSATTSSVSHTWESPTTETVTLTVTDSLGFVGSASSTIAIGEINPTVTIGTIPSPIHAGTSASFSVSASSPSTTATQAGFSYDFSWGDGSSDSTIAAAANNTNVSAAHDYSTPGTYLLTVMATDEFGGIGSASVMVTVLDPSPAVALNAGSYSIALGSSLSVTGTASSTYAPAESAGFTFAFAWGDGATTSTASGATSPQTASHSYDAPGTYTLKLTVTDNAGVASSTTATVTVTQVPPAVTIGTIPVALYAGISTTFSASATSVSTSATSAGFTYVFSWGDGTTSTTIAASAGNGTGVTATHSYSAAGSFTLTVTATDKYSEAGSRTASIAVYNKAPAVTLNLSATGAPIETAITATATATASYAPDGAGGFTFVYSWGDGTANTTVMGSSPQAPSHTFDIAGTFSVSVSVTDATGVAGTATKSITVSDVAPSLMIGALPAPAYAGFSATYSASATSPSTAYSADGFTYLFAWGDGTSNTSVAATANNGSGVSTTHTYAAPGTYTLTVTATDAGGSSKSSTASVTIYTKAPSISLGLSATNVPIETAVTANATATASWAPDGAGGFSFVFSWGDGTPNTTITGASPQAPTHAYDTVGTFTVSLTVTDATGVAATTTKSVTVSDVAPTVTIGALPLPVYADISGTYGATATSPSMAYAAAGFTYVFAWGDGTASTTITATSGNGSGVSTSHTYAAGGPYTLTVTATDKAGASGSSTATVTLYSKAPAVVLTLSAASVPIETAVTATTTATASYPPDDANGFTFVYAWGDGTASTTVSGTSPQAPTHSYDTAGTFTISVSVTDATGVPSTATKSITVTDVAPTVAISPLPVPTYAGSSATFSASATSPSSTYTAAGFTFLFAWGDGTTSSTVAATSGNGSGVSTPHTYTTAGSYTLTVTATDAAGTAKSSSAAVTIYTKAPLVGLSLSTTSAPIETSITATGTITASYPPDGASGFTSVFSWGDGSASTTLTGPSPEAAMHAYDAPGTYTVLLTATDATGVASSTSRTLTVTEVAPTLTIGAVPVPVYAGEAATFSASATSPSTTATNAGFTYVFAWGDGTATTSIAPTASNGMVSPAHTYATPGSFTLSVTVTDRYGGSTTRTASVAVYDPKPTIMLQASPTTVAVGGALQLTLSATSAWAGDSAAGFSATIMWGDGKSTLLSGSSPLTASHAYDAPGSETIQVSLTDATGIQATASTTISVTEVAPSIAFGPLPSPIYAVTTNAMIAVTTTSPSAGATLAGFTYVFAWGDGTPDTTLAAVPGNGNVSVAHVFPNPGSFTVHVTATDEFNGVGSASAPVTVLDPIPTVAFGASSYTGPAATAVSFSVTASSPLAAENTAGFTWSFDWGDGNTSSQTGTSPLAPSHVYDVGGVYTATVTVKDAAGTSSPPATTSVVIGNVAPVITQFVHPDGPYGTPITFSVAVTDASMADTAAGFQIAWDFGDGTPPQTGMNLDTVAHTFAAPGTFTVTVTATDENDLQATATGMTVAADTVPVIGLGGNQTIAHNTPITLTPTITPENPAWTYTYAWDLGDHTTASTPAVTRSYSAFGVYTVSVTVTDPYGASGSTSIVLTVVDTPPAATGVTLSPANPDPLQPLNLSYTYADPDNDAESGTTIVWYLNGQIAAAYNNLLAVPGTAVQRNQQWYAVIMPSDGYLFGPAVKSNVVTVGDPPPSAQSVVISPAAPRHADMLTLSYSYSDPGAYPESGTTIVWMKNGTVQPMLANQRLVPPPLTKGDVWTATVTPSDGFAIGASVTSPPVTVQDTAPVLNPIADIAKPATMLLTSASWTVSGTDIDNDLLTFDCAIGSRDLGPGPSYTASFPVGTTLVSCSVSDGTATTTGTFHVAIGDVPPVVAVPPAQTVNPGAVSLTATGQDPLGRPVAYQWTLLSGPASLPLTGADTASVTFVPFAAGNYVLQCTVSNGSEQTSAETTVTVVQLAPLVNLGPALRTMVAGETITLDGSHSVDPNGGQLSFKWSIVSGLVQLSSATSPTVSVTASIGGRATVSVTVSNGAQSATGSISINIWSNASDSAVAPSAVVGADQTVLAGSQVTLDGTGSFDPGAHVLMQSWVQVSGPSVTLVGASSAQPSFVTQTPGTYVFALTVTDGTLTGSATSTVTVLPQMGDQRPVAAVSPGDASVHVGATAAIDGSASTALAGHPLTYQWSRVSGPYVVLSGATQSVCQVTPYGEGELILQLVVNDGTFSSLPALATIHVTEGAMNAPSASAQVTPPFFAGLPVVLDGTGSSDPNGLPLLFQWQQLTGAPVAIHGSETAQATFTPLTAGSTSFQLTVFDWIFGTSAQVLVSVQADELPIAVATSPALGYVGDTITLDGRQSRDPMGRMLTFAWTQRSGPTAALAHGDSANPTFAPATRGTYVFQLVVSNGLFASAPATVTVSVQSYPTLHGGGCTSIPVQDEVALLFAAVVLWERRRSMRARAHRHRASSGV